MKTATKVRVANLAPLFFSSSLKARGPKRAPKKMPNVYLSRRVRPKVTTMARTIHQNLEVLPFLLGSALRQFSLLAAIKSGAP